MHALYHNHLKTVAAGRFSVTFTRIACGANTEYLLSLLGGLEFRRLGGFL